MLEKIRILIVEDEVVELNRLERSLKRTNYSLNIYKASSAEQSLSVFRESTPDVVILDLGLSESGPQSGLDLIPKFKEIDSNARIIVLTGHASEQVGVEAVNRGASSFLLKPANVVILNALINDYAQTVQFLRQSQTNQNWFKTITNDKALTLQEAIEKTEVQLLTNSLKRNRNNISAVCEELGIPRTTLWRKLKAYQIDLNK